MLRTTALLMLIALASNSAFAHGPSIEIIRQRIVTADEDHFLEVEIHAPEGEEQVALTAVVAPTGTAILEERQNGAYQQVFRIPIPQVHVMWRPPE